jgi:hypothetical protein
MTTKQEVTAQDVTASWRVVEKARDELLAYATPGSFYFDTGRFYELAETLKQANDEYARVITEWATTVLRK